MLDVKNLLAKLLQAEPKEESLSNTAHLYRAGKLRMLVLNHYKLQENIILAIGDRPSYNVESIAWINNNGRYFKCGNVYLDPAGVIRAYTATSYNANSPQTALGTAESIMATLVWLVGGGST